MHADKLVRADYWDQLTSEVEEPSERRGEMVWTVLQGRRNEALDCEVLALHAARSLRLHTLQEHVWVSIETQFRQATLFAAPAEQRSAEHPSELQSLMRISYAVFCLQKKHNTQTRPRKQHT